MPPTLIKPSAFAIVILIQAQQMEICNLDQMYNCQLTDIPEINFYFSSLNSEAMHSKRSGGNVVDLLAALTMACTA